jgi:hypothetical protein
MARTTKSKDKTPETASTTAIKASRQNTSAAANPARKTANRPSGAKGIESLAEQQRTSRGQARALTWTDSADKPGKSAAAASSNPSFRAGSKSALIVNLLKPEDGATMAMLTEATGWQKHSIRGFISAALKRDRGIAIASHKDGSGNRRYKIVAGA